MADIRKKNELLALLKRLDGADYSESIVISELVKEIEQLKLELSDKTNAPDYTNDIQDLKNKSASTTDVVNSLVASIKLLTANKTDKKVDQKITSLKEDLTTISETFKKNLEDLEFKILTAQTKGGGSAHRLIANNGTVIANRYADLNLIGSGITITATDNNITKRTDVTLMGSSGGVTHVYATDSTMTISPNDGDVNVGLNLNNANTWTASQTMPRVITNGGSGGGILIGTTSFTELISGTLRVNGSISVTNFFIGDGSLLTNINANNISGTLPTTTGGTGTNITFTAGSVVFAGTSGIYTQDNTNLNFNNSTKVFSAGILNSLSNLNALQINGARVFSAYSTGVENTFIGYFSGNATLTGADNLGVGYGALFSLTNGANNMALGPLALLNATTGFNNVGVGVSAMTNMIGGSANVGIGTFAFQSNTAGSDNVGIGFAPGFLFTGSQMTSIGSNSGRSPTTGTGYTLIGFQAGYTDGTTVTADNLTNANAFGYYAQVTQSNSLILGGTGSFAVKVGIGVTAPTKTLDVKGDIQMNTAGNGFYIKEGTNATMGTVTLVAGTVVVSTTKVTANSRIQLTTNGGTLTNVGSVYVSARTAGTSFTITSLNILDASSVAWFLVEPAP